MSVTMKDIAMLAGISRQAVSAVLSGSVHTRVSEATSERVLKLARELNYIPNQAARSLSGGTTHTIGLFGNLFSPYGIHAALLAEISGSLRSQGYQVIGGDCGFGAAPDAARSLAGFISRGVDGIIVCDLPRQLDDLAHALSVPHVLSSPRVGDREFDVGIDMARAGHVGTKHLVEHGHRHIAYLRIAAHEADGRITGWRQALRDNGIEDADRFLLSLRDLDGDADALLREIKRLKVTAVYTHNDSIAAKLMKALLQRGVGVPDDIAVVGFDGSSFAEFCPIPLTTVVQPIRKQAEAITELLFERIGKAEIRAPAANILILPLLYRGGSCGCPARTVDKLYRINSPNTLELDYRLNSGIDITDICDQCP